MYQSSPSPFRRPPSASNPVNYPAPPATATTTTDTTTAEPRCDSTSTSGGDKHAKRPRTTRKTPPDESSTTATDELDPALWHHNVFYASVVDAAHPRFPASVVPGPIRVSEPFADATSAVVYMPDTLLVTRALAVRRVVYSHCTHFFDRGVCQYGAACTFVHAVAVDPKRAGESAASSKSRRQPRPLSFAPGADSPPTPPRRWWFHNPYRSPEGNGQAKCFVSPPAPDDGVVA